MAALMGGEALLHPVLAFPAALSCLWLFRHRLQGFARLLVVGVLGLSAYRAQIALSAFTSERDGVAHQLGASDRCSGTGRIVSSPQLQKGKLVLVLESSDLDCTQPIGGKHRIRVVGGPDDLGRGDQIAFVAQLGIIAPLQQLELPSPLPRAISKKIVLSGGALSVERIRRGTGLLNWIDRARTRVRRRILATYSPRASALGRALVLGENDLEPDEQIAFQKSGLSHLLAVSGTHLVFAVVSIVTGLRAILLRIAPLSSRLDVRLLACPIGAVVALAYADFAGGSGSAWRAAFMLCATYVATSLKRRLGGSHALAYSILAGAILDPWVGYDVSFLLSAGATAGLITLGQASAESIAKIPNGPLRLLLTPLATTVSAMIPCAPLLLLLSPQLTIAGIIANVIAGPIGEMLALPLCLTHAISSFLRPLETGLALAGSGALSAVAFIAKASAAMTVAQVELPPPTAEQFLCLGVTGLALLSAKESRWRERLGLLTIGALCLISLEVVACRTGAPRGKLRVTAVDVGQGDALLVDFPDGRIMLVDGGGAVTGGPDPGRNILAPLLRARRRRYLDVVVLTHPHPDHYGGLATLLEDMSVREFWAAEAPSRDGALVPVLGVLARKGTTIRYLPELCRSPLRFGLAQLDVLGPCPSANPGHDANDQSIVLRLSLGRRAALLAGDAAFLEEREIVQQHRTTLRADLLKVGHHGSRWSTSEAWLSTVQPALALISVGARNRFGHPHPATLERLNNVHVPVYRTDELGSVVWQTDGDRISVTTARSGLASH